MCILQTCCTYGHFEFWKTVEKPELSNSNCPSQQPTGNKYWYGFLYISWVVIIPRFLCKDKTQDHGVSFRRFVCLFIYILLCNGSLLFLVASSAFSIIIYIAYLFLKPTIPSLHRVFPKDQQMKLLASTLILNILPLVRLFSHFSFMGSPNVFFPLNWYIYIYIYIYM